MDEKRFREILLYALGIFSLLLLTCTTETARTSSAIGCAICLTGLFLSQPE
jgi:hypothetical protein